MADGLIKVDYESIWNSGKPDPCERRGVLYRGKYQRNLEANVVYSALAGEPSYWGTQDDGEKLTFCSPTIITPFLFVDRWLRSRSDSDKKPGQRFPYSFHPLIMEINAGNYKDSIYISSRGEGLAIRGPIRLEDITILYSTKIDKLKQRFPSHRHAYAKKAFDHDYNALISHEMPRDDLLDAYANNPMETTGYLLRFHLGVIDSKHAKPEHLEAIAKSMEALRAKLR